MQGLPPPRPIPIRERSSILFIEKGRLDVLDGAFVVVDEAGDKHANTVEGKHVDDKGQSLSVCGDQHGVLKTASIAIEDWADPVVGKHLTVWFQDGGDFAALFPAHDHFKAYYPQ
jgi:hypothetical protein